VTIAAASGPNWTDIMTAFGTVGAVIAAVGIALWAEWRSGRRLAAEREHSDRQLEEERAHSRAQIEEERALSREHEQFAEAHAVQVAMVTTEPDEEHIRSVAAIVVNRGTFTIRRVEARFWLPGPNPSLVSPGYRERVQGADMLNEKLLLGMSGRLEGFVHDDILTPWDIGVRFEADPMDTANVVGAYPVVRWTDRWGTRWEYRRGEVRQVRDDESWSP
jgi:hypothetical protein